MLSALTSWLGRRGSATLTPARPRARLALERLEGRLAPAVNFGSGSLTSYAELIGDPGTPYVWDWPGDVVTDQAGDRYIAGYSKTADSSAQIVHIHKVNADNSLGWVTVIPNTGTDAPRKLAVDQSGNVYAALGGGPISQIVKLDPNGVLQQLRYQAPGAIWDLATDNAEDVYYTGTGTTTARLRWPDSGPVVADQYPIGGFALAVSPDGSRVYVTHDFEGTVDFDPTRSYSGNPDILTTQRLSGGRWDRQAFVLDLVRDAGTGKLRFNWVGQFGGPGYDTAGDIAMDAQGVYVMGRYQLGSGTSNTATDFDPGPLRYSLPGTFGGASLTGGLFLVKLGTSNQFQWAKGIVGPAGGTPGKMTLDGAGGVYVSGATSGPVDFDIEHNYRHFSLKLHHREAADAT